MTVPALASVMLVLMPLRPTLIILGLAGFAAAVLIMMLTPRFADGHAAASAKADTQERPHEMRGGRYAFPMLFWIGVIDSATRMGFLTFLPFILTAKGASLPVIGLALTLVFAGGAIGKLACAYLGARIGMIGTVFVTEILTLVLILAILPLPLEAVLLVLPLLGVALNGTSSVLYGSVPDLVEPHKRTRAFGIFYTGTIGAGAIAPIIYGFVSDAIGLNGGVILVGALVVLTMPLAYALRPAFAGRMS